MKIVYHHCKSDTSDWWTCPPELICSKDTEEIILNIWHKLNGENAYVVDPLSHKQALYYIFRWQIPFTKFIIPFLKKEHIYEED